MYNLTTTLRNYFGYTTFRPLQKEIITDVLAKKDVFVLMPTGGGKSLCYQIPSLIKDGTTIVVSPLISLMKDQVDTLLQNGITAAYLNSSLSRDEQQQIIKQLTNNKIKLLYVAPERLLQQQFLAVLKQTKINFFAIDEAHCISQWGHDFRPEYRQLDLLRNQFPNQPLVALTATATPRVKEDIINRLTLKNPKIYQASFDRPNLSYYVVNKQKPFTQILNYITSHPNEAGIIYCQSRKTVENVAKRLREEGISALPYHAGLPDEERKRNQEKFLREDVDIIVATIAFGMGINKSNVRFIIHYDLPKTLEHYYQETGRAGRDGLPSECLFLYSYGDKFAHERFINEKPDEEERRIAKAQLQHVINYAKSNLCRRSLLLHYFAEKSDQTNCASCDNCLSPKETFDATITVQKILSCVYRVDQRFGTSHIINILTGSKANKILQYNHHLLSTYDIIDDYTISQLKTFIYELVNQGYLKQSEDQFGILSLTSKSSAILKGQKKVFLTKTESIGKPQKTATKQIYDTDLFQRLRFLRKKLADEKNVPPYVIFSDATLREMAEKLPTTQTNFSKIKGVGAQKLKLYAALFLKEINTFTSAKKQTTTLATNTVYETLQLYLEDLSPEKIAKRRNLRISTITEHLAKAYELGKQIDIDALVSPEKQEVITKAFEKLGFERLAPVKELLGENFSYEELKLTRAKLLKENQTAR